MKRFARPPEKGTIMVLVLTVLAALLAGGAVALYVQVSATRATASANHARMSLFCAEAGLQAARPVVARSYADWPLVLGDACPGEACPVWYEPPVQGMPPGIYGRLDDTPIGPMALPHYRVTLEDNDDEYPVADNDPTRDNDLRVFVRSQCLRHPSQPRVLLELVEFPTTFQCTQVEQIGGCEDNANSNRVSW